MTARDALIPAAALALLLAGPAVAQQDARPAAPPPPPPPAAGAPTGDDVIVTAPRSVEPDFQTVQEFHAREFARLNAIYGKPPPVEPRGDQSLDTGGAMENPNNRSSTVDAIRNAPPVRETLGNP